MPSGVPISSRRGGGRLSWRESASSSALRSAMDAKVRSRNARSSSVMALRRSRLGSFGGPPAGAFADDGMGGGASRGVESSKAPPSSVPGGTMPRLNVARSSGPKGKAR